MLKAASLVLKEGILLLLLLLLCLLVNPATAFSGTSSAVASRLRHGHLPQRQWQSSSSSSLVILQQSSFAADGSEYSGKDDPTLDDDDDAMSSSSAYKHRGAGGGDDDATPTIELSPVPMSKNAGNRFVAFYWDADLADDDDDDRDVMESHNQRIALTEDHVMFCRKTNLYNTTFNQDSMVDVLWSLPM